MNTSSNNIFNKTSALHGVRKYSEIVNDIPNKIHQKLYDDAIKKLIKDLDNYDLKGFGPDENQTWEDIILSINEISYTEYWTPSDVIITFKDYNDNGKPKLRRFTFDLSPYWGNCYSKLEHSSTDVKYNKNIPNDVEIVKYDYIRGKAVVRSKLEDIEYDVDFDVLNDLDVDSENVSLPYDTFTNLVKINI